MTSNSSGSSDQVVPVNAPVGDMKKNETKDAADVNDDLVITKKGFNLCTLSS